MFNSTIEENTIWDKTEDTCIENVVLLSCSECLSCQCYHLKLGKTCFPWDSFSVPKPIILLEVK